MLFVVKQLQWYGHTQRMEEEILPKKISDMVYYRKEEEKMQTKNYLDGWNS